MSIRRTISCDICGTASIEKDEGSGWPGWGALHGVAIDGIHNPSMCPQCLGQVAEVADKLRRNHHGMD